MPAETTAVSDPARGTTRLLSGWGRTAPSAARVLEASNGDLVPQLESIMANAGRGLVARGLARSYGDAAQCGGGTVVDMTRADAILEVDPVARSVRAQAGTSLARLCKILLPKGLFLPVTPGTRWVTLGGAIAADVHGKNHHQDGSLASWVRNVTLVTPGGGTRRVGPEGGSEEGRRLYWATAGGLGLTGIIAEAEIGLLSVETSRLSVDTERAADLDDVMARMEASDHRYRYSVAWVDGLARGRHLGRGVLTRGEHAALDQLPSNERSPRRALAFEEAAGLPVPPWVPGGLLRPFGVAVFNRAWYRRAPRQEVGRLVPLASFFYPLDGLRHWNRLYGPLGFVQYQVVVPFGAEAQLRGILERLATGRQRPYLVVLKRFGAADPGPLSFPLPGWTLALDLPAGRPGMGELLDELDQLVAAAGGRVYLAKDSRLSPDLVGVMYPRLDEWRAARTLADPTGVLCSDLGRRLGLAP